MKLNKQDEYQVTLFEEYIDTLIDRRVAHIQYPGNDLTYEEVQVAAAKTVFLNEVFKNE